MVRAAQEGTLERKSLGTALGNISSLRKNLSAKIVIKEGYNEEHVVRQGPYCGERADSYTYVDESKGRWVDAETVPDTDKQEEARAKLQEIIDSSGYFSSRYFAAKALKSDGQRELEEDAAEELIRAAEGRERKRLKYAGRLFSLDLSASLPTSSLKRDETSYWEEHQDGELAEVPDEDSICASIHLWDMYRDREIDRKLRRKIAPNIFFMDEDEFNPRPELKISRSVGLMESGHVYYLEGLSSSNSSLSIPEIRILEDELQIGVDLPENELRVLYDKADNPYIRDRAGEKLGFWALRRWGHELLLAFR